MARHTAPLGACLPLMHPGKRAPRLGMSVAGEFQCGLDESRSLAGKINPPREKGNERKREIGVVRLCGREEENTANEEEETHSSNSLMIPQDPSSSALIQSWVNGGQRHAGMLHATVIPLWVRPRQQRQRGPGLHQQHRALIPSLVHSSCGCAPQSKSTLIGLFCQWNMELQSCFPDLIRAFREWKTRGDKQKEERGPLSSDSRPARPPEDEADAGSGCEQLLLTRCKAQRRQHPAGGYSLKTVKRQDVNLNQNLTDRADWRPEEEGHGRRQWLALGCVGQGWSVSAREEESNVLDLVPSEFLCPRHCPRRKCYTDGRRDTDVDTNVTCQTVSSQQRRNLSSIVFMGKRRLYAYAEV
ncbi:hypothetical protein INR49_031515 [Caranx melampygus]|nr:hypothetical protein INR49_031515 [Caranx melampygus]